MQSHDYIAMERLYEIHASGPYDLIVVDTPPTRNAIDFLEAPERMADFFSQPPAALAHRAGSEPGAEHGVSKPFYPVADRILGSQFLEDIAEFFLLFQTMYDGFVERAEAVTRTLADRRTTFVVVSTLESAPVREAEFFIDALRAATLHLGAVVLNKVLPGLVPRPQPPRRSPRQLCAQAEALAAASSPESLGAARAGRPGAARGGGELPQLPGGRQARGRAARRAGASPDVVATVPYFDDDIPDLAGLLGLGEHIWR